MKTAKTILALSGFAALTVVSAAHAQETPSCTNATIIGDYAFIITGQVLNPPAPAPPSPSAGPVTGVAMTHFDGESNAEGEGSLTQVDHVVHNGTTPPPPPADQWRPGNGPYKVNPDCTGWMTITSEGAPAPLTLYFVIGDNGNTIHTAVSNPNINITSSATRVRQAGFAFPRAFGPLSRR